MKKKEYSALGAEFAPVPAANSSSIINAQTSGPRISSATMRPEGAPPPPPLKPTSAPPPPPPPQKPVSVPPLPSTSAPSFSSSIPAAPSGAPPPFPSPRPPSGLPPHDPPPPLPLKPYQGGQPPTALTEMAVPPQLPPSLPPSTTRVTIPPSAPRPTQQSMDGHAHSGAPIISPPPPPPPPSSSSSSSSSSYPNTSISAPPLPPPPPAPSVMDGPLYEIPAPPPLPLLVPPAPPAPIIKDAKAIGGGSSGNALLDAILSKRMRTVNVKREVGISGVCQRIISVLMCMVEIARESTFSIINILEREAKVFMINKLKLTLKEIAFC